MKKKTETYKAGLLAESMAVFWLRLKGYRIVARRFKTPVGEIDIVAARRGMVVFLEVKGRRRLEEALGAVTPYMQNRIVRAAQYYLASHPADAMKTLRFDIFAFQPPFYWRHLDNAWRPPT